MQRGLLFALTLGLCASACAAGESGAPSRPGALVVTIARSEEPLHRPFDEVLTELEPQVEKMGGRLRRGEGVDARSADILLRSGNSKARIRLLEIEGGAAIHIKVQYQDDAKSDIAFRVREVKDAVRLAAELPAASADAGVPETGDAGAMDSGIVPKE
jgi:hypothetical protein